MIFSEAADENRKEMRGYGYIHLVTIVQIRLRPSFLLIIHINPGLVGICTAQCCLSCLCFANQHNLYGIHLTRHAPEPIVP